MPVDGREFGRIKDNIVKTFNAIGVTTKGTVLPTTDDNRDPLAAEYFIATLLRTEAEGRKQAATNALIEAKIIRNHRDQEVERYPIGLTVIPVGKDWEITCTANRDGVLFDRDKLKSVLRHVLLRHMKGIPIKTIEAIYDDVWDGCTESTRGNHTFRAQLKGEN